MPGTSRLQGLRTLLLALVVAGGTVGAVSTSAPAAVAATGCQLGSPAGQVQHVINLSFDNVHFTRDNPNVPSDLEQMPNLLNFIKNNGTLLSDHHTPLVAHTSTDNLTAISGLYGDRHGVPIGNTFRFFNPNGTTDRAASFTYWNTPVTDLDSSAPSDTTRTVLGKDGKNAPAPWVPFTKAGCNFGAVGAANSVLENAGTDIPQVFGNPSPEYSQYLNDPSSYKDQENADYQGLAIHCAAASVVCSGATGVRPDALPDEPGGYTGYQALYGNKYLAPKVSPTGPITDLNGNVINNPYTATPGFPGFDKMDAATSLGYVAALQEHGVPVTYAYLSDLHDNHSGGGAYGPGSSGYQSALAADDAAFGKFFARLAADGINRSNTLFTFTADEGDHFAGVQQSGCDGTTTPCTYGANQIGEINTNISGLLATQRGDTTPFAIKSAAAPSFYVNGNPATGSATARTLERDVAAVTAVNPYTNITEPVVNYLADPVEEKVLHMVTADPARTPTFTAFAKPSYWVGDGATNCDDAPCVSINSQYAWIHGTASPDINTTWLAMVGPGVKVSGVDSSTWSDHTDIRPTTMSLLGLTDDYVTDGRVLIEDLTAVPPAMAASYTTVVQLAQVYKKLEACTGSFGMNTLKASTKGLASGSATSDTSYTDYENQITGMGNQRDQLGAQMIAILNSAAFSGTPVDQTQAQNLINQGNALLQQAQQLAGP